MSKDNIIGFIGFIVFLSISFYCFDTLPPIRKYVGILSVMIATAFYTFGFYKLIKK